MQYVELRYGGQPGHATGHTAPWSGTEVVVAAACRLDDELFEESLTLLLPARAVNSGGFGLSLETHHNNAM